MKNDRPIKLAFVGAGCTGKTTLVNELRIGVREEKVAFVDEAARAFFQNYSVVNRFSAETQGRIQDLALQSELMAHSSGARIILCDRSVIDAVVYVKAQGDEAGARELLEKVQFWLPTYHKLLLLDPKDIHYEDDEVRHEGGTGRLLFHTTFERFLSESRLAYELLSGTLEERVRRVNEILSETPAGSPNRSERDR